MQCDNALRLSGNQSMVLGFPSSAKKETLKKYKELCIYIHSLLKVFLAKLGKPHQEKDSPCFSTPKRLSSVGLQ